MPARRKRTAIVITLALLTAAYGVFTIVHLQSRRAMNTTEDVYTALVYYLEVNSGIFPATELALTGNSFIEHLPNGRYIVRSRPESRWRPQTYGEVIRDFNAYDILWAADLGALCIDPLGRVMDPAGREVYLMRSPWPGTTAFDRDATRSLVELARELRKLERE